MKFVNVEVNKFELIYLYIDEFHFLAKNPDSMNFFYQAFKRFRKYNAGAIAGTQQIVDVLDAAVPRPKNTFV